jgi:hypothetical protein
MKTCLSQFANLKPDYVLNVYDKLVVPVYMYASEVWGIFVYHTDVIEKKHLKFLKSLLNVRVSTENMYIYGELARLPLTIKRQYNTIKYWCKIVSGNKCDLITTCYTVLKLDCEKGKINWVSKIKSLLSEMGLGIYWLDPTFDTTIFLSLFTQRAKDIFIQKWRENMNNSSRIFYKYVKTDWNYENYLNDVHAASHRIVLTRIRTSAHNLFIETGRWTGVDRADRKCNLCNIDVIEDEFHIILECDMYADLRIKFIPLYYRTNISMHKLINMLQSDNSQLLNRVSKFLYCAFKRRNELS